MRTTTLEPILMIVVFVVIPAIVAIPIHFWMKHTSMKAAKAKAEKAARNRKHAPPFVWSPGLAVFNFFCAFIVSEMFLLLMYSWYGSTISPRTAAEWNRQWDERKIKEAAEDAGWQPNPWAPRR